MIGKGTINDVIMCIWRLSSTCLCYCLFCFFDHTIPQLVFITVAEIHNSLLKSSNADRLDINHKACKFVHVHHCV